MGKQEYTFVKRNILLALRNFVKLKYMKIVYKVLLKSKIVNKIKRTLIKKIDLKLMHTFTTRE